jgi:DNA-binding sugar fermentation-stimulating protein
LETLVFLIVMGIVSVIFRKAKGKTGQSRNRTFSRDTFEEIRSLVKKQLNYDEIPTTSTLKSKNIQSEIPLDQLEKLENKYQQLKQESEVKRIGMSVAQPKVEKVEVKSGQEEGSIISLYPDEKTLINGMVWSEILGEPRSKKPFFPRKG